MSRENPLVLIADDERNAVILLTRILERDGFSVESARDGESALEKAQALRPDLILMDVQMPKMNGFEVTERLREDPSTARIPVIFVTAAAREPSDVAHGLKLGADDYIRKPYNYHELLARAHSKMRARQLEDRLQRRSEEMEALVNIGAEFNQRLGLNDLVALILEVVCHEFEANDVELYLFDDQRNVAQYVNLVNSQGDLEGARRALADSHSIAYAIMHHGEPVLFTGHGDSDPAILRRGFDSAIAAPLIHHGNLVGILIATHPDKEHFNESNLRMLRSIGEQAALAVRNAQLYAELQSYAQNLESMVEKRTQELQAAQAQLLQTEKLAALGRLAAGVAHEVNNPLQPILNCLEVAIEDIESDQRVDTEILRVAEAEVQRIKLIVSRLLDFARPSAGDKGSVNLHTLVGDVLALTSKQMEQRGIRVERDVQPVRPVTGNAAQLKQVLLNLVLNAMEAMPEGGMLAVSLAAEGDHVALTVADSGIGMSREAIAQIFEPFYSTKEDGTGLGLAVTYGIVQGHGGDIRVDSQTGAGSRFTILLP